MKKFDGNDLNFCQQFVDLASRQFTSSHGTIFEGVFLAFEQMTVLEYLYYSPDLAPSDIFPFPKIKEIL